MYRAEAERADGPASPPLLGSRGFVPEALRAARSLPGCCTILLAVCRPLRGGGWPDRLSYSPLSLWGRKLCSRPFLVYV